MKRSDAIATRIASAILGRQTKVAAYLNRKTAYWNQTSKVLLLVLFCLAFGGLSIYLLLKNL
jgi:hypothetical protein